MGFGSIKINSQKVSKTWVEKKLPVSSFFENEKKKRNSQKKEQLTLLINKEKKQAFEYY